MSTLDLFLAELKSQYNQEFELKSNLENKGNYLLVASGITMTLLFSFGSVIIDNLRPEYHYLYHAIVFLMLGVITNGISILFSVFVFAIKPYSYAVSHDIFYNKDGILKNSTIEEYRDGKGKDENDSEKIFKESMIETYLRCNKYNSEHNHRKAIRIKIAQWLFFGGIISIPFTLGFTLPYIWTIPS